MLRSNDFFNSNTFRYYVCIVHYVKTIWGNRTLNTYYKLCSKHMRSICIRIFVSVVLIVCNRDTTQLYPSDLTSHIQKISEWWNFSNSHGKCSMKKAVLKNSEKFTGKHQYQSLFSNKVEGLRPATLLKKSLWHRCSCEFCEIWKSTFFTEHLWTTASEISVYSES